jgi:hypothetical protein
MTEQIAVDSRVDNGAETAADAAVVARVQQRLRDQGLDGTVGVNPGLRLAPDGAGNDGMVEAIARRVVHAGDYEVRINTGRYGEEAHPDEILEHGSVAAVRQDRGLEPLPRHTPGPRGVVHSDVVAPPGTPAMGVEPHARPQSPEEHQAALRARVAAFRADRVLDPEAGDDAVSFAQVPGSPIVDSAGNLLSDRVVGGPAPVLATSDSAALAEAADREAARLAQQAQHPMVEAVGAQQVPHRPAALDAAAAELSQELPESTEDAEIDGGGHVRSKAKRGRRRAAAAGEPEAAPPEPEATPAGEAEAPEVSLEDGMFPDGQAPAETA